MRVNVLVQLITSNYACFFCCKVYSNAIEIYAIYELVVHVLFRIIII